MLLSALALTLFLATGCDTPDAYSITAPNIKISDREAVLSFELAIKGGMVQDATNLPVGWEISIQNDVGYVSKIVANSRVGSATLSLDELKRVVWVIKRDQTTGAVFEISGNFRLTKDGGQGRSVDVTTKDFTLAGA